jgi:hypothetical protein
LEAVVSGLLRDWDAQIEAAKGDEALASIGILRCSQRSHRAWLDYIEAGDYPDEERSDGLMDSEFHRRCIDEYERIIGVIERLRSSTRVPASGSAGEYEEVAGT